MIAPTYDGQIIFGWSVTCRMTVNPTAQQINAFFGVSGQQSLFGGLRGRVFLVSGVMVGDTIPIFNSNEGLLLSYIDGIARVFTDTQGSTWPNVLLIRYEPGEKLFQDQRGFYRPYRCELAGLT